MVASPVVVSVPTLVAVLGLAACGDNLAPPRLTAARYVYDDGTEQIDRHQLYDRTLATLCTPTEFSDGFTYCEPDADEGFFADDKCNNPISRVRAGQAPRPFVATTFTLGTKVNPSRVYRTNVPIPRPGQRHERVDGFCFSYATEDGYDWYTADDVVVDLERVRIEPSEVIGKWQIDRIDAGGLSLPWRVRDLDYGPCEIPGYRADESTTWCRPTSTVQIFAYADVGCTIPIIASEERPDLAVFVEDDFTRSVFHKPGLELADDTPVYELRRSDGRCYETPLAGNLKLFTVGETVELPTLNREAHGNGRLQSISVGPLPILDDLLHDTALDVDCYREIDRCVPYRAAPVDTWFADSQCGQAVDVAFPCTDPPMKFARRYDFLQPANPEEHIIYPLGAPNDHQLYELDTGDTCSTYEPLCRAYSIGPALGADAFARATLVTE